MRANGWKRIAVCAAAVALMSVARPVQAQSVIQAVAGVTKTAAQHPVFAGTIGRQMGIFEIDGEFGKMQNIVPKTIADTSFRVSGNESTAELPAWYGMGLVRLIAPSGLVRPFAAAGLGLARLHPQFSAPDSDLNVPLIFGENGDTTKFLLGAGAGLRVSSGRLALDGGYRFVRVFQTYRSDRNLNNDDVLVNVHMFYVALGVKF